MNKILTFDSIYLIFPFNKLYNFILKILINNHKNFNNKIFLCRLDINNIFLHHELNVSEIVTPFDKYKVDEQSVKFYRYLKKLDTYNNLKIDQESLYELYPRQVKLKLAGVIRCAQKLQKIIEQKNNKKIEILTDLQTASIFKEALLFLNIRSDQIFWNTKFFLTLCITCNSLIARFLSILNMKIRQSKLPKEYFLKLIDSSLPTIVITMPVRKPDEFFTSYVSNFKNSNILLYSCGKFDNPPREYERFQIIKKTKNKIQGIFKIKNIGLTIESYIDDILLIYRSHDDLAASIDIVNQILSHKVNAIISRNQTSALEVYLAKKSKENNIFVLADLMEEVYYCDAIVCPTEIDLTDTAKLALAKNGKILYKNRNDLIRYRLHDFKNDKKNYLHDILKLDLEKKIIFYASNPMKNDEKQRYLTEKFLINYFALKKKHLLVIKTHRQDNGLITNDAYEDCNRPANVILVGDKLQKRNLNLNNFKLLDNFEFNSALNSSNGFLTISSTSILQALMLKIKTGVIDKFHFGHHKNLIRFKITKLIDNFESLDNFLLDLDVPILEKNLTSIGLNSENFNHDFDLEKELIKLLSKKSSLES